MCRHYDLRYIGECNHDFADKVLVKDKANFCSHFKPSARAFEGTGNPGKDKAEQELHSLFGQQNNPDTQAEEADKESETEVARNRLNELFDDWPGRD